MVEEDMHFAVLSVQQGNSRLHTMGTVNCADDISLMAPLAVEIQPSSVYNHPLPDVPRNPDSVVVFPEGDPVWVEPRLLADWTRWSTRLLVYRDVASCSAVDGCMLLGRPERASPPFAVLDDRCPTLAVIAHNRKNGWISVPRSIVHTDATIGQFYSAEAIKWKVYHQCLAVIDKTMALTTVMPSREVVAYYKLLLRGVRVEAGRPNKEYLELLNTSKRGKGEELEPIPLDEGDEGNDDGVITPGPRPQKEVKAKRGFQPPGRLLKSEARGSNDPPPPPTPVPVPIDGGVGGVPDRIVLPGAPPPDAIVGGGADFHENNVQRKDTEKNRWVPALDGVQVCWRRYQRTHLPDYVNWKLKCNRPGCGDACIKTKGDAPDLIAAFGQAGPLAYLHAWKLQPAKPGKSHVATNPDKATVRAYAVAHREELKEEGDRAIAEWD